MFNETLVRLLEAKNIITSTEAITLTSLLKTLIPQPLSKYYTREVRDRLLALLNKDLNEYTLEDVRELERIADLMFEEYAMTRRKDLLEYQARLRVFAMIVKILYVEPKILRGESSQTG
ncbi:MAG: hypothetical protein ABWJ42_04280 [Sulfolobales archaeon]